MVIIINHQITRREYWSIHKVGCRDIKKTVAETAGIFDGKFATANDAIADILDDEIVSMGYEESDIKVYNCAK